MALKRITLRDFVIVRELDLELDTGFSVLTGETGAGKSILIDALQLALGSRADAGTVREGAARADISAEFDSLPAISSWLDAAGFDQADSLLLRRTVDAQGKSRSWINGSPATATQLREIGDQLLDIHGQHAWQSLTRPDTVRSLLDAYAGTSTRALEALWTQWRSTQKALADAQAARDSRQQEQERLAWQIGEVGKLNPGADEWAELNAEHTRLSHTQALLDAVQTAIDALEGEDSGALAGLSRAHTALHNQEHIAPEYAALAEVLASSLAQAEDAAHSLHTTLRKTELDPARLGALDDRLSQWVSLARRYKRTPAELPVLLASWKTELARLDAAADSQALETAERKAQTAYRAETTALTKARNQAAPKLAKAITLAMQGLGMQGGQFQVALQKIEPSASGLEEVQFLVAGHAGSTPRAVGKVASGGELSRIALAIAVTTSELGTAQTLIFDEVDSGVGGAVAETVGRLMKQLGRDRQVLAVTHLPQVAACADHHLVVAKQRDGKSTVSSVALVLGEQRVAEVARMLGGEKLSGTTLAHAKEMLGIAL
ncbi:DNA repair protein RecN [Rhodoferax sp.]|uniref:DNA repair protein RecN n=1 Tax=Rhodoferax sp. TaxID=50421 RepID=UPI0025E7EE77|nr:DNA repair protein RecN [Rhodoferax sp.]